MATTLTELPPLGAMTPLPFRVSERTQETSDTWTLVFEPVDGVKPVIRPGQFMMVSPFGIGEVPISVSGPPNEPGPVVLTVRSVGAVSAAICASQPGAVVGLRGPFGNAWPIEAAAGDDVLVVAGGIGLAPLRPVILHTLAHRRRYHAVSVLYGARTPDDLLYVDELPRWANDADVFATVDSAGDAWRGRVGVVPKLIAAARFRPEATTAFVCGPEIMIHFSVEALVARGLSPERIFVSLERHMQCGVGLCGHCQLGPTLICRDGPVYSYAEIAPWVEVREL